MKLLIVDDHALNLKLLRAKLEGDGHVVLESTDGVEALEILHREVVDGVISDILMPRMDGYRLCMEVRSRSGLAQLPFVLYTSTYNSPGDRQLAESLGADAYLAKPAPTERIVGALEAAAAARLGATAPAPASLSEPVPLMKQYNEVLIRKLEEKALELELAHEGLLDSQTRLSGLIATAMDAIVAVNADHRIVLFNDAAGRMFGCSVEQALGRSINDFIPPRLRDAHDRHLAAFAQESGSGRLTGPRNVYALRADGSEFPIEANISRLETSQGLLFTVVIRDITERRRAEVALQASEAGLRRAQDVARMAHAVLSAEGVIETRSESFATLLGMAAEALPRTLGEWLGLVHPDDREKIASIVSRARRTHQRADFEYRIACNGEWRWIQHILEPLPLAGDDDNESRTFNTLQDVTEQRQAEHKIRQLNHVYAVLSAINSLIVRVTDRDDLFEQTCRILVDTGHFQKAWIGMVGEGVEPVRIIAWAGAPDGYFDDLQIHLRDSASGKSGLIDRVLKGREPVISNDIANDLGMREREDLVGSGSLSFALLPLVIGERAVGVLAIHAPVVGFFDDEETKLLLGLAGDISFALDHLLKSDRISYLANHDVLTGLPNRTLAMELVTQHLSHAGASGPLYCVALLDLVRFRRINDTLGRGPADELLAQVASRLRTIDTFAARLGPDLFLLQMKDCRSATELAREFESIATRCFGSPFHVGGEDVRMGCRIGAAVFPGDGHDADSLLRNAEAALRRARTTVTPFVFYAQGMNASANEALAMESRLRRAIDCDEFVLHYQPKVRFSDRLICGVEALIRWQDPDRGLVPPMRFIPVLEETGLINTVGNWALQRACADLTSWIRAGAAPIRVAVNVSPLQLNQAGFASQVGKLLADGCGDANLLELEITESVIMDDFDNKIRMLREIRDLGVHISVDDFGTGYSSLAYISRLPITYLKIDRTFITGMTASPEGYILVSSIIALAHALKLKVVAEGVETEEQAQLLKQLACDEAQGFLFSRPIPADQLQQLLVARAPLPVAG
jgi:PAS domain S-box-containing protein/diguanylate cyclase (GGDEF)-like protein